MRIKGDHTCRYLDPPTVSAVFSVVDVTVFPLSWLLWRILSAANKSIRLNPADSGVVNWETWSDLC